MVKSDIALVECIWLHIRFLFVYPLTMIVQNSRYSLCGPPQHTVIVVVIENIRGNKITATWLDLTWLKLHSLMQQQSQQQPPQLFDSCMRGGKCGRQRRQVICIWNENWTSFTMDKYTNQPTTSNGDTFLNFFIFSSATENIKNFIRFPLNENVTNAHKKNNIKSHQRIGISWLLVRWLA